MSKIQALQDGDNIVGTTVFDARGRHARIDVLCCHRSGAFTPRWVFVAGRRDQSFLLEYEAFSGACEYCRRGDCHTQALHDRLVA